MAFKEDNKPDNSGCGMMCCTIKEKYERQLAELSYIIERKDREMQTKENIIKQKDKEIMAIKEIQDNLDKINICKEDFLLIFDDLLNDLHPFYNFLIKKA